MRFSDQHIVRPDKDHDHDTGSDGHSRFGSYIGAREDEFYDRYRDRTMLAPEAFAAAAWRIATVAMTSPPYVRLRSDIAQLEVSAGEGQLTVEVTVPLDHHHHGGKLPYDWQDWHQPYSSDAFPGRWPVAPVPGQPPVVLLSAQLQHAGPWQLIDQQHAAGRPLVDQCIEVVDVLAGQINQRFAPMVATLYGTGR